MELEGRARHKHYIGLGHTRWATHGDKTDVNAHPHYDQKERIALIHNGLIENYHQLKEELRDTHGIKPLSQTDTEIVALWIGVYLDQGLSLSDAISKCVGILEGAYSFVLISILEPDCMYIVKNTGTMVIGVAKDLEMRDPTSPDGKIPLNTLKNGNGEATSAFAIKPQSTLDSPSKDREEEKHLFQIVASDTTVFQDYTKQYYNIDDKEIIKISLGDKVSSQRLLPIQEEKV